MRVLVFLLAGMQTIYPAYFFSTQFLMIHHDYPFVRGFLFIWVIVTAVPFLIFGLPAIYMVRKEKNLIMALVLAGFGLLINVGLVYIDYPLPPIGKDSPYYRGEGAEVLKEYVREYRKAAEQGDASAQYNLGRVYENGRGVAEDFRESVKWYRKAAEQGFAPAQYKMGQMHDPSVAYYTDRRVKREGIVDDITSSLRWYRKAAEQGHPQALYEMGRVYEHAREVKRDLVKARMWYAIALKAGEGKAGLSLTGVTNRMSESEISRSLQLSKRCVESQLKNCE